MTATLLAVLSPTASQGAPPTGTWLHVNGYSRHFSAPDANSELLGVGLSAYRAPGVRFLRAWEADLFRDSGSKLSCHVGHSWMLPFNDHLGVGVIGAAMYHRNFQKQVGFPVLPVALPFLQAGNNNVMARFYYVPPVRKKSDHQVALQLLIRL